MTTFALRWLASLLLILPVLAQAQWSAPESDDSDLAGPRAVPQIAVPRVLAPDQVEVQDSADTLSIQVLRQDHGQWTPVPGLHFVRGDGPSSITDADGNAQFATCSRPSVRVTATLRDSHFSVSGRNSPYQIALDIPCTGKVRATFQADSNGGQALGIWQIVSKAKSQLQASVGLAFWKSPIQFIWPAEGDYYSWGSVHLTRGDHWDVVGHEMGHAIYDQGGLGQFGGGPHKIDECYSVEMALSEGWASMFSAWVSLPLDDEDAKFEFMVPRRAPIRFETIPADVCRGEKNEWRVNGFFWDLIDLHDDGETMTESFARVWKALEGSHVKSASAAMRLLEGAGMDPELLRFVWKLNFSPE